MKFSTRTRYGLRAMIEIASSSQGKGIFQKEIAANQDLSNKYLDQIIHALKVAGLIANVRGRKSGYVLTRSPETITILDIHKAFEHGICVIDCMAAGYNCERESICNAKGFWGGLNQLVHNYFESITLFDLVEKKLTIEDFVSS